MFKKKGSFPDKNRFLEIFCSEKKWHLVLGGQYCLLDNPKA